MLQDESEQATAQLVLAHGAGAGMDTPFMNSYSAALAEQGIRVVRFEFPYMARTRLDGKRRPPDRAARLMESFLEQAGQAIEQRPDLPLFVGGKSMGGRIASMICDALPAVGLICLGYPLHPPGKLERLRTAHLYELRTPALILQGQRDPFGRPDEFRALGLPERIELIPVTTADHDFKPRRDAGVSHAELLRQAARDSRAFIDRCLQPD
jgi:predicted alpha/beta-hydrolase family hydrolase